MGLLAGQRPALPPRAQPRLRPRSRAANARRSTPQSALIFSQPGKTVRTREIRSALNVEATRKDVNTLYIWQWRTLDGTYEAFNTEQ